MQTIHHLVWDSLWSGRKSTGCNRTPRAGPALRASALAVVIAAGAEMAYGDAIAFSTTDATADFASIAANDAVNGTTIATTTGWKNGTSISYTSDTTIVPGGEGLGGNIAVFPLSSPTATGSNGTDLTFDLYQLYTAARGRIGGFEIEVTTDPYTPSVGSGSSGTVTDSMGAVSGIFSPVTIQSVVSANNITSFSIDPNKTTAGDYGDYVIAQTSETEPGSGPTEDIYDVTAFTTLTGITGVELIAFYTLPDNGTGTTGVASYGLGDGPGLDLPYFVLTQITGTATAVAAPEPTALGMICLPALLMLRRRRRPGVGNEAPLNGDLLADTNRGGIS